MFYEEKEDINDSFNEYEEEEIIYEGVLLTEKEEGPPVAIESNDTKYNEIYIPYTVEIEVRYENVRHIQVGIGHAMGYAIDEEHVISSKHLFKLKDAEKKGYHAIYNGITIIHNDGFNHKEYYIGIVVEEPKEMIRFVEPNTRADANDFIVIKIISGKHKVPIVISDKVSKYYDTVNNECLFLIGGPTPKKGGWTTKMLPGAKLIAETQGMKQLPTASSIENAFPSSRFFTCAIIERLNSIGEDFVTYQKSTLKSWSGAPALVLNKEKTDFVRKKGNPIIVFAHCGELVSKNMVYGIFPIINGNY